MDFPAIELGRDLERGGSSDARAIGDITADAFRDDPFNRWLFGRFAGMAGVFGALARHVYLPRGYCIRMGDEGAAMWMLPGGDLEPPLRALPALYGAVLFGSTWGAKRRTDAAVAAMARHHPAFPHAYLFTIGVRPSARGKGLGRSLIQPVLDACDRAGVPAYLENSNPANRGFYRSCGFERQAMIDVMPGAPPLEAMLRPPRWVSPSGRGWRSAPAGQAGVLVPTAPWQCLYLLPDPQGHGALRLIS
ncbi:GNAT family N-acetyltransferase [Altererythrobacter sp. TH136]|uniref:GNAT family N-acetyltransferase n=1 Tax=Altererythrobacter sp. TH136 TaxID=2067415 RepID=UPI00143DE98C|nr:GNAT family N-acetyltransferase [Altererythrobacter sp. TH136]